MIRTKLKLEELEENIRYLYDCSPFSIMIMDINGIVLEVNPATEQILGYSRSALIGKSFIETGLYSDKYKDVLIERHKRLLNGEIIEPMELQVNTKEGKKIWINVLTSAVPYDDTTIFQCIIQDISDQKESELKRIESEKKLRELDKLRKDFLDRASHALKSPLTAIFGAIQLLQQISQGPINEEVAELHSIMLNSTKRMKHLVDDLLDLSRLESEKLLLTKKRVNLIQIINKCIDSMKHLIIERNLQLSKFLPSEVDLLIDAERIAQVICNLLSNAIKNTPPNGTIRINVRQNDNTVEFSIKDSGIGITEEEMKKLFERFCDIKRPTVEADIIREGTGLGLYISKEILNQHGGQIWAESEGRNKGAQFFLTLPLK